jgi:hypothetical protein
LVEIARLQGFVSTGGNTLQVGVAVTTASDIDARIDAWLGENGRD